MTRSALVVLAALVLAGCGGAGADAPAPGAPAAEREPAPEIAGTTLDGERVSLADFRGRPVFVVVWASW